MIIEIKAERPLINFLVLAVSLLIAALLGILALSNFIVGAMTDERVTAHPKAISAALNYLPSSAGLHYQLARTEMTNEERDLAFAEIHAQRAVRLSPWNYNYCLLLAVIEEARGDRLAAERALRRAVSLAPNNHDVHWRLANLLLREGNLTESLEEFRVANSINSSQLASTLNLVWQAFGDFNKVSAVTGDDAKSRLILAQFLVGHSAFVEAARVFSSIDINARLQSPQSGEIINSLIAAQQLRTARQLWLELVTAAAATADSQAALLWNGGFESDPSKVFNQFDWRIGSSSYARVSITSDAARTGSRSLMIAFTGRDTTKLDGEFKQLIATRAGASYRLECFVKTDKLDTPEGPSIVIMDATTSKVIASSAPIASGSSDWQPLAFEFTTPEDARLLTITIKRTPKFSYDDPTRGTIWLDDFSLTEKGAKR
ncbi:MAG TPA: hypothetical protein VNN73_21305 [Blastocatellia bacterium]|nr:hypothetical protein [Blastocatellia bacterium]